MFDCNVVLRRFTDSAVIVSQKKGPFGSADIERVNPAHLDGQSREKSWPEGLREREKHYHEVDK